MYTKTDTKHRKDAERNLDKNMVYIKKGKPLGAALFHYLINKLETICEPRSNVRKKDNECNKASQYVIADQKQS